MKYKKIFAKYYNLSWNIAVLVVKAVERTFPQKYTVQ